MSAEKDSAFKNWINYEILKKYLDSFAYTEKDLKKLNLELQQLELKQRVQFIAKKLNEHLPAEFPKALKQLMQITRKNNLNSFGLWPATEFIQMYGINHPDDSLTALYELTQKFTSEFAVRPFINRYQKLVYLHLLNLTKDPNEHVRRWLSEGTRPRLPWGEQLPSAIQDPSLGLKIIEQLKFDKSLYVRKSVANHLNDISKDHPDIVIQTLSRWKKLVPTNFSKEFEFIKNRSLRTLIKSGNNSALKFLGVTKNKNLKLSEIKLSHKKLFVGDKLTITTLLKNNGKKDLPYILDYEIGYNKANSKINYKVFKLKKGIIKPKETLTITKNHSFKVVTTRKLYPGLHTARLKLSGVVGKEEKFYLLENK